MKKEVKDKWVAALRSGDYPQTTETLYDNDGFCCLGVLCDLYISQSQDVTEEQRSHWDNAQEFLVLEHRGRRYYENAVLPESVMHWSGMLTNSGALDSGVCLVNMNDQSGLGFETIANFIEENWEEL